MKWLCLHAVNWGQNGSLLDTYLFPNTEYYKKHGSEVMTDTNWPYTLEWLWSSLDYHYAFFNMATGGKIKSSIELRAKLA